MVRRAGKVFSDCQLLQSGLSLLTNDCPGAQETRRKLIAIPSYRGVRRWPQMVSSVFQATPTLAPLAHHTDKQRVVPSNGHLEFVQTQSPSESMCSQRRMRRTALTKSLSRLSQKERSADGVGESNLRLISTIEQKARQGISLAGLGSRSPIYYRLAFPRDSAFATRPSEAILAHAKVD